MTERVKSNTRKNAEKKAKIEPELFPEDTHAFLLLLLAKVAMLEQEKYKRPMPAQITVKMESLRNFRVLHAENPAENQTQFSYDPESDSVTLRGADVPLPEVIYTGPKKKVITEVN